MKKTIASVIVIVFAVMARAQGCSDAGFCSVGNLTHPSASSKHLSKHYLKLTLPVGVGDDNVFVVAPGLEYGYTLKRWKFSGKMTASHASGNLANVTGAGDVFLSATYQLPANQKWQTSYTLGAKLPLNQGNLKAGGLSLPMQYQSSLGTVDLIAGIALGRKRWSAAAGWQQPLTGINRNNFLPQYWRNGKASAYPPTNDFNRKGDVLLRTSYRFLKSKRLSFEGGLLGIYHLGEDTYIDANVSNKPISIKGSQGLTLNVTGSLELTLNPHWSLGLVSGVPLVVRDVRPDGLTRSFVIAPQLIYQF